MIKAPKVIVTTQACLWWGQELWAHPYTSMKWGARCPADIGFAPTGAERRRGPAKRQNIRWMFCGHALTRQARQCPVECGVGLWGARCPVDIGFAPTVAKRRPRSTEQSVFNQNVTFGVRIIWMITHKYSVKNCYEDNMKDINAMTTEEFQKAIPEA